ncbi:MAG: PepSY domain-containing protein [Bradyrhizobiaceae bacterium]|jgi:hypothetical protein|nr:MAG: PepSY domain-containing protein [Bradyrhizobiaceae bacterium]
MRGLAQTTIAIAVVSLAWSPTWLPASAQQNPAMENPGVAPAPAPIPGANSFSQGQARDRLMSQGYSDVSQLTNDSQGIWRGTAMRGGKHLQVGVDYKGNISAQPE